MTPSTPGVPGDTDLLVLIVDDSERNRKLARDVLRAAGFRTLEAATGGDAIELAAAHVPDVILMDIQLPDTDGTETARRLGEHPRTRAIPVLAMSSLPRSGNWFASAGFAGYLEKPFDVRELAEQVRSFCADAQDR